MKTVKEWLSELPEEHREKALKNMNVIYGDIHKDSAAEALAQAFIWEESIEGYDHWHKVYAQLLIES